LPLRFAKTLVIAAVLLAPDYYVVAPELRVSYLAMLLAVLLFLGDVLLLHDRPVFLSKETLRVVMWAFALLFYVFVTDAARGNADAAIRNFLPGLMIPVLLIVFEYRSEEYPLRKVLQTVFFVSVLFGVLQVLGVVGNLTTLAPGFWILKSDQIVLEASLQGLRITGATTNTIGFALQLGFFIILAYSTFRDSPSWKTGGWLALLGSLVMFTQTRSLIYGLVPSVVLVSVLFSKQRVKKVLLSLVVMLLLVGALALGTSAIERAFPRLYDPFDLTVMQRIQTNVYAAVGVWSVSPIFGVPRDSVASVVFAGLSAGRLPIGDVLIVNTTNHNQLGFYFRYYGLVGLAMLLILYWAAFRKVMVASSPGVRLMLLSMLLFEAQYSMLHNNKLVNSPVTWILLSMAVSVALDKGSSSEASPTEDEAGAIAIAD
jgi:hypothetical protein